ncbi:MAG: GGDEF domain-containing protein [Candidatus Omnitrophica bacterium]|nr:GGDEF domain-containing protein [Candidatus Omnitrophota bacterium]MDD4013545.1 GGDEF domain-containing protein [Candidatus Omnitrophota bacterium]
MKLIFPKTRYILYLVIISVFGWFLFNYLISSQSEIMYKYFIEKPTTYNLERAERLAFSIYQSFKKEVLDPSHDNIRAFVTKYNDIPFLSVNFVYNDGSGGMKSILDNAGEIDILRAEYVYPIRYGEKEAGTLLVYDINKEYKRGLEEYAGTLLITRIFFGAMLLLLVSILIYREYTVKIEQKKREAEYEAVHDGLTGLYTHKYFLEHLDREIARSQRYKRPLSLLMCDVDHFKKFNDTYGHLAGDKALKTVAAIISENIRASDIVARYGGEEFAILLVETSLEQAESVAKRLKSVMDDAAEVADRIKGKIEHTPISVDHKTVGVTISMGLSSYYGQPDYKPEYLIGEADHALYESKNNGRNMVTIFDPETKKFKSYGHSE